MNFLGECLQLGVEFVGIRVLLGKLVLEQVDGFSLAGDFAELRSNLGSELLDGDFKAPRRHREFCAQIVLVGLKLRH